MHERRGGAPASSMAADAERHHHADIRQIRHANEELGSKGAREFLIVEFKNSGLSGA